ncbi:MAG: D-glycero-beta-D-manno-heptose 1-phosphate adenylyltransferase [Alphaproteobacteria bacterium]
MTDRMNHSEALVARLAGAVVLVVGDLILDRFVDGRVDRLSSEAPIPVLVEGAERRMPGGAGNVARNLAALGATVRITGVVGEDADGEVLKKALHEAAGDGARPVSDAARTTTGKTRFVAGGQQLLRVDREDKRPIAGPVQASLIAAIGDLAPGAGAVVLSDYGNGVLTPAVIAAAREAARAAGVPLVVDPKGRDFTRYGGADLVTPNRAQLHDASGMATDSQAEVVAAATALREAAGVGAVLATLGGDGMVLVAGDRSSGAPHVSAWPAEAREVFDVSGAGDTGVAALAAGLAAGVELETAIGLANTAAGLVVAKVGTAVVRPDELIAGLTGGPGRPAGAASADKVLAADALVERVERWRRQGLRVAFTNGCFDLIHPGHVSVLAQARAAADRLIVGLNTDASVRRLKGAGRPLQEEGARAQVLAAFADVDAVGLFDEDTPVALIERLRPDVLVKGADYRPEDVPGREEVESWGGRLLLVAIEPGFSTTGLARKASGLTRTETSA